MKTSIVILSLIITSCFFFSNKEEGEIFLIPEGYTGTVVVFFNMPNGKEGKTENDYRVYEIDSNGVLFTTLAEPLKLVSLKNIKYYYYNKKTKKRTELKYIDKDLYESFDKGTTCIFSKVLENGVSDKTHKQYDYMHFIVGTMRSADSLYMRRENTHLPNLIKE